MIKRYYQSLLSIRYSFLLVAPSLVIFFLAFRMRSGADTKLKWGMYIATAILIVVMALYYTSKFRINKGLKTVQNKEEFERGGMMKDTYIAEDRILTIDKKFNVREYSTKGITGVGVKELRNGCAMITCTKEDGVFAFEADSMEQAKHFAAYAQRKNPHVLLTGISPKGKGYLKEFGAGYEPGRKS